MEKEVSRVISAMHGAFERLRHVFMDRRISVKPRLVLFNAVIVQHGVYGCQGWNLVQQDMVKLDSVYFRFLRQIMGIYDELTPLYIVMDRARSYYDKIFPLECHIGKTQLRYLGHVARRSAYGNCMITKAITTAFIEGTGRSGGPQMDFRTAISAAMKNFGIKRGTWEKEACVDNGNRTSTRV